MGLVNMVVPQAELMRSVFQTAGRIAENASLGIRYAKECIVRGERVPLEEGPKIEKDLNMFMTRIGTIDCLQRLFGSL